MISQQVLDLRMRLLKLGWTQVDLATQLYKTGSYKSRSSLQVQVNYMLNGKRNNKTSEKLCEQSLGIVKNAEEGKITLEPYF